MCLDFRGSVYLFDMAHCKTKVLKGKAEWRSLALHILRLFMKKKKGFKCFTL